MLINSRLATCICFLTALCIASACNSNSVDKGDLKGKVTFQSNPITTGMVVCENREKGIVKAAKLDENGEYAFKDLLVTEYLVSIHPQEADMPNENSSFNGTKALPRVKSANPKDIPPKVRSTQTTPLKKQIESGENVFDLELSEFK